MVADRTWVRFTLDIFVDYKHRTCRPLPVQLCVLLETPAVTAIPHARSTNAGERAEPSLDAADAPVPAAEAPAAEAVAVVVLATIVPDTASLSDPDAPVAIGITVRTGRAEGYGLRVLPVNVGSRLGIIPTPAALMVSPVLRELALNLSADPTATTLDWSIRAVGACDALISGGADLCQFGFARGGATGIN